MNPTVALIATLALAAPDVGPQDAAGWRAESDARFARGDYHGALEAAQRAGDLDATDPWVRFAWIRALAAIEPDAARAALPGLLDPAAARALAPEEHARLNTDLGYLCLELGLEPFAALYFGRVPAATPSYAQAQAGLAILAVRRGHARQALAHFSAARAAGKLEAPLAELERETRFRFMLHEFATARDLRDANAASRAYAVLDELRPNHPATLRARADLAKLRGDAPARERALRELLAADRDAAGAADELIETLLALDRPAEALAVARELAPERLARDPALQSIERSWVSHLEAALAWRRRESDSGSDRLTAPELQLAWVSAHPRWGRLRIAADGLAPDARSIPAGAPFGSSPALPAALRSRDDEGVAWLAQWAPTTGVEIELGHTPPEFAVDNVFGALRFRVDVEGGRLKFGLERQPVADSLLSLAGVTDPVTGRDWGGVMDNRAYVRGSFGGDELNIYGRASGSLVDGRRVDENARWEAGFGFWRRAALGSGWQARVGGQLTAFGYTDNLSQFTIGHGGYFSPSHFLSLGPTFELSGRRQKASFRIDGGLSWQKLREGSSDFFPLDPELQAANGDPRYAGSSRQGLGARLAAAVEWRVSSRAIAGLRLEGMRGEDFDEVRLQIYTRRWKDTISEPAREPPRAVLPPGLDDPL